MANENAKEKGRKLSIGLIGFLFGVVGVFILISVAQHGYRFGGWLHDQHDPETAQAPGAQ